MIDFVQFSKRAHAASLLTQAALNPDADTRRLDAIVKAAAGAANAASSCLSLMTDTAVTVSVHGKATAITAPGVRSPFADTICYKALYDNISLAISDAAKDPRIASTPAVASGHVRCYLGAALRTTDGDMVGILCAVDDRPRLWSAEQQEAVTRLAEDAMAELTALRGL